MGNTSATPATTLRVSKKEPVKFLSLILKSETNSTKFRVSEKEPARYWDYAPTKVDLQSVVSTLRQYEDNHCTQVIQGSNFSPNTRAFGCGKRNGFVETIIQCYNTHHNLIIRPDDVWTAIITQFSFYVNANAEEFRSKFVAFEGKKELVVYSQGTLHTASFDSLTTQMTSKIDENLVDPEFKDWILPNFSTTTKDDIVTCGVVFMASMKKDFDYKMCLCCGIPWITLEGTLKDWETILSRLEKLKSYKLDKWFDMLEPILQQFVNAKRGQIDLDFWNRICHKQHGGSGPTYLSGWITAFCVFNTDGEWQQGCEKPWLEQPEYDTRWPTIEIDDVPAGVVEVDVTIDDNGTTHHSVMFAGHMALEVLDDGFTLSPKIGWAIALKPSPEEIEEIEKKQKENRGW